ncbi:hypothetical protein Rumeso_03148 [Rubellimicrobium mesophilum DSM 19309]|uniref:Uncharacterized protein n=1 Tax=Rubellimicrobium mesophilum DSM 19309 TaxID=442562 RepID=A0A017HL51_9RHOB|nr:hypothetical protein [Rubellimicrobium mesophilum]EYD75237.1 hypothetical protein Rumeso_03148 [Rubellimicrobium mesophilum DSM 19309]
MCWTRTEWDRKATETRREETATPTRFAEPPAREAPRPEERRAKEPVPAE